MVDITPVNINAVNLNLFVAFDALYAEKNVTRAARRLGVTQSALSNALQKLRLLFDDPLFLRGPRGITPTPRALEVATPIQRGLAALGASLAPSSFDAATAERTFIVAASDYVLWVLLPRLLRRLAIEAPRVRIEVRPWGLHEVTPWLATGEADLMIGYFGTVPSGHHSLRLFSEEYVCLARKGHPTIGPRPSLEDWVSTPHVVVSERPGSTASVDRVLAKRGLERTIGVRVTHFLLVPEIVARTDFVAALSGRVARPFVRMLGLRTFAPPLALPTSHVGQVWHERLSVDAGHRWLRGVIAEICALPEGREPSASSAKTPLRTNKKRRSERRPH
jgi:DNA-binding transcriptional LysR family regulator